LYHLVPIAGLYEQK